MTKYSSLPFNTYIKRSLCEIKDFFEILKCVDKFHINYTLLPQKLKLYTCIYT